ncbi:MAG: hypothetical protein Q8930_05575 [Bacillota bacterium]|nr:hypothetical protein [Bacillota bacterium]
MALLAMLLTLPLLYVAVEINDQQEELLKLKLFSLWLLCQTYILLNHKYIFPLGISISIIIVINNERNRQSKLAALLIGILSFSTSIGVSLLYRV